MFLGFCNLLFLQKEKLLCMFRLSYFIHSYSFVFFFYYFVVFCCFLRFIQYLFLFLLIFTSGIIIIIQNVTYWYNYCFSKAVVIGDNHNHNHNHKCYNVYLFIYLFIYLSTQRTPFKYGPVGTAPPPASGPCSPMSCSLDHAMTGFQC